MLVRSEYNYLPKYFKIFIDKSALKVYVPIYFIKEHIIFINLFCTPSAAQRIVTEYPNLTVLTTELHPVTPNHFGQRYFGTDHVD